MRGWTAVLSATKFACSGHPAKILLTSYGRIGTTVSVYHPSSTATRNKTSPFSISLRVRCRSLSRAGRGGGRGDNENDLETNPKFIDEMGSFNPIFDMVTTIEIGSERSRDSSQNASQAPSREKDIEGPEANLACG